MRAINPATGESFGDEFARSTRDELAQMAEAALEVVDVLADAPSAQLAGFIDDFAMRLESDRDEIAAIAHAETALPLTPRLREIEFNRTTGQLRMAANGLRDESWREVAVDANNNLRSTLVPLGGAVLCLGPCNFPLAYNGVSGGDFCSAIMARNPVIAKAHPSHPNTTARMFAHAGAARDAASLPPASVQMFFDCANEDGEALLAHRGVAALGFTGSRAAGVRLKSVCDALGKPASLEMASINPIFVASNALTARHDAIADAWTASLLMAGGQQCTKPGVIFVSGIDAAARFIARAEHNARAAAPAVLLSESIRTYLSDSISAWKNVGASIRCGGNASSPGIRWEPTLLSVDAAFAALHRDLLHHEAFGPLGVIVICDSDAQLVEFARALDGQLAGTIVSDASDANTRHALQRALRFKVGRMLDEAMPTGVVVSNAMVHGGPFPATGDARFTAVGLPASAKRFSKTLCWDRCRA